MTEVFSNILMNASESIRENGIIEIGELKKIIKNTTILITIMFANNEIGTIQPIKEIGKIAKENNVVFHTDAVQATRKYGD